MSTTALSYQRLKNYVTDDRDIIKLKPRIRWPPLRLKKFKIKKRLKIKIIPRFMRRKARTVIMKVLKRLKESQAHFGDLFAGNYLFMQVNPTPLKTYAHAVGAPGSVKRIEDRRFC